MSKKMPFSRILFRSLLFWVRHLCTPFAPKTRKSFAAVPARLLWHKPTFPRALASGFCCRLALCLIEEGAGRPGAGWRPRSVGKMHTVESRAAGHPASLRDGLNGLSYVARRSGFSLHPPVDSFPRGLNAYSDFRTSRPTYFAAAGVLGTFDWLTCARHRSHPGTFYSAGQSCAVLSASTASRATIRRRFASRPLPGRDGCLIQQIRNSVKKNILRAWLDRLSGGLPDRSRNRSFGTVHRSDFSV